MRNLSAETELGSRIILENGDSLIEVCSIVLEKIYRFHPPGDGDGLSKTWLFFKLSRQYDNKIGFSLTWNYLVGEPGGSFSIDSVLQGAKTRPIHSGDTIELTGRPITLELGRNRMVHLRKSIHE